MYIVQGIPKKMLIECSGAKLFSIDLTWGALDLSLSLSKQRPKTQVIQVRLRLPIANKGCRLLVIERVCLGSNNIVLATFLGHSVYLQILGHPVYLQILPCPDA